MRILDVGCGNAKAEGAIGIDHNPASQADVVADLDHYPYPFPDRSFDRIIARSIIEHVESPVRFLEELHRLLAPGGTIHIETPHYTHRHSWEDPTHRHHFSSESIRMLCDPRSSVYKGFYKGFELRIVREEYTLTSFGKVLSALFGMRWYEKRLAYLFPIKLMKFTLERV